MKIFMKRNLFLVCIMAVLGNGCNTQNKPEAQSDPVDQTVADTLDYAGDYVTADYSKRNEGFDWVAVSVSKLTDSTLQIRIRSRIDKKKPSCTFDAEAKQIAGNQFRSMVEGKGIVYTFTKEHIEITTEKETDSDFLQYYCSGGGTIGGKYQKLDEPLDESQIDQRVFIKTLSMQNIGFDVSTTGKGSLQQLKIVPFGLTSGNKEINTEIDGSVTNAEIEDLNSDGFPELLIYTTSAGSGSYGNVIGYSVNNGKSMSSIYFPPIAENKEAGKGYMGHDEFAIVETSLVQRFKTYKEGDPNSSPTGNIRQIQYKLVNGEAGRKFEVVKISEFPGK